MTERARSVLLTLLLVVSTLSTVGVGAASAAASNSSSTTFHITQGSECYEIQPRGDGTKNVSEFYDYRPTYDGKYASHGTTHIQDNQVSHLFVYRGSEGLSLVMLHDELGGSEGGAISFDITGLPENRKWAVEDDSYDDNTDDNFDHSGTSSSIDWMWSSGRTDGAAVRGLSNDFGTITIDSAFGENSWAYTERDNPWPYATNETESWKLLDDDGTEYTLTKGEQITIEKGSCPDTTNPDAALSANQTTVANDEAVEFDASGSSDSDSGIAEYRWDFNGDGEVDRNTTDTATVTHAYESPDTYEASVTVVDAAGNTATATETIKVESSDTADPTVEVSAPETVNVSETFEISASASDESKVDSYEWNFDGTTKSGSSVTHTYETADTHTVSLTWTDSDGDQHTETVEIEAVKSDDGGGSDPVDGSITYLNGSAVEVNGTFEKVEVSIGYYTETGIGSSHRVLENVSGTTVITADAEYVNGSMINLVGAYENASSTDADLQKENPRLDHYAELIEPRPVTVSTENVTQVGDGTYEVTFGYENPNDESLTMRDSTLAGNVSGEAPREVAPGNDTFTVTWTPDSEDERASWTLNRSNFDQSDVTAETKTAGEYGYTEPGIEFVNESAVRVTGDFAAVNLTTVSFTADGKQTATHTFVNVSNETLLTPSVDATWGPVTKSAAAFESASDDSAALSAQNPDFASQLDQVRPEKVSTFVDDVTEAGNGTYEVTFGYVNPNDQALKASESAFTAGNTSDQPPATFAPGRNTFTATWTPESNESNLVWRTDLSNFGYTPSTATSPTPDQIADGELPPTADLSVESNTVKVDETITFDASASSDDSNVTKYLWDFDSDDEIDRNTTDNATIGHVYRSPGTYEVTVTVVDESGQTDTASETVVVEQRKDDEGGDTDEPPVAKLTAPEKGQMSLLFYQLDASASTDDEGIEHYHWDVNNNGSVEWTSHSPNATTSFKPYLYVDEPGKHEASVTVEDASGQTDTATVEFYIEQVTPTADVSVSDKTVEVGEEVTFTASNPNQAFDDLREYHWKTGDRTSSERASEWTTSFDETGEHTVELVLKTRDGVRNTIPVTVEVTAADDGGNDHDSNDGNDGGLDDSPNTGSRSGSIGGASPGGNNNDDSSDDTESVSAPMRDADSRVGEVVVTASGSDADPAVDVTDSAPDGVTAPTVAENGFAALSYLNVSGADEATFTVSKARLEASDAGADAVSLFRYDEGSWTMVETAQVNETGDAHEFRANVSDGVYAVGVGEAVTSVADVSVDSQRVEPGQQVTVTATIRNTGYADGTREVELTVGGEVVATKSLSVAADGTTDVTFTRTFDESGVYEVSVGDASAEVVVEGIETQTTTDGSDDGTTEETTSDSSSGIPGFGVGVSLVALIAAALLALRRQ